METSAVADAAVTGGASATTTARPRFAATPAGVAAAAAASLALIGRFSRTSRAGNATCADGARTGAANADVHVFVFLDAAGSEEEDP